MKKKKILHIVESFGGGIFSFLVDLINGTDDEFDIVVAYGKRAETPENFKSYFNEKIKFIKVQNFTRSINPIKDLRVFFEVRKIIKEEDPDVIHLHSSKAGFIGRFATNCKKKTMLYNPHGFSFLMKDCSRIKRTIYWLLEKFGALRKCTIVGCSKGEYKEALKLSKNSICINNGINIEKLSHEIENIENKKMDFSNLKICTSARIGYQKNPELFNEIAEAFPNLEFTWIGDGELKEKLISPNIKITGWKTREEALRLIAENDIFLLTSLWEGLPIALLEAMFLKKICVVSNVIGNNNVIKDNFNGFLCNQLENYIETINNIMKKRVNINKIKNNSIQDVIDKYSTKKMCKEYRKLYN